MSPAAWSDVRLEHLKNVGFLEGPNNHNTWTEEMGCGDVSYCVAAATIVPFHRGFVWPADAQFAPKGFSYCPYLWNWACKHGFAEADHSPNGKPALVHEGDIYLWDWNSDGVADHAETALADDAGADGFAHNILGYNTGSPEGCHSGITRPRKYLLGVVHMCRFAYTAQPPAPAVATATPAAAPPWPGRVLQYPPSVTGDDVTAWQQRMKDRGWAVEVDGEYGPISKGICISFQQEKHLDVDGQVGPQTWAEAWTAPITP